MNARRHMPGGAWILSLTAMTCAGLFAACSDPGPTQTAPIVEDGDTGTVVDSTATPDTATDLGVDSNAPDTAVTQDTSGESAVDTKPETKADTAVVARPFFDKLSQMDLYSNFATKTIDPKNIPYAPTYTLWTDGATKRRWINLPAGTKIDNSNIDNWQFPVGTRMWKEFTRDGVLVETRLVERLSDTEYRFGSYVWDAGATEATWTLNGATDVNGTPHDVPTLAQCQRCHEGELGRSLSFSAIQLAEAVPLNLKQVSDRGMLTVPVQPTKYYGMPGSGVQKEGLGYMHANCGHCHNPNNTQTWPLVDMVLRISTNEANGGVASTVSYLTTVNQPTEAFFSKPFRISGGNLDESCISHRASIRTNLQMPPIATELVHTEGLKKIQDYVMSLPPRPDTGVPSDGGTDAATDSASGG